MDRYPAGAVDQSQVRQAPRHNPRLPICPGLGRNAVPGGRLSRALGPPPPTFAKFSAACPVQQSSNS